MAVVPNYNNLATQIDDFQATDAAQTLAHAPHTYRGETPTQRLANFLKEALRYPPQPDDPHAHIREAARQSIALACDEIQSPLIATQDPEQYDLQGLFRLLSRAADGSSNARREFQRQVNDTPHNQQTIPALARLARIGLLTYQLHYAEKEAANENPHT